MDFTAQSPSPPHSQVPEERRCRECGCLDYAPCLFLDGPTCWWVEEDLCSGCADDDAIESALDRFVAFDPLDHVRARDWLRSYTIEFRDSILLDHDDAEIVAMAMDDGLWLTCPGDIRAERDRANRRLQA